MLRFKFNMGDNQKRHIIVFLILLFFVIVVNPFVNADLFDRFSNIWDSITGNAAAVTTSVSVTINRAPVISDITSIGQQTISEQTQTYVTFYFNVSDSDGSSDINGSSAKAQFNRSSGGSIYRTNTSCNSLGAVNSSTMRFGCTVDIWYFDNSSFGYNVSVRDNSSNYVEDTDQSFTIASTQGMAMSPTALTFPTVTLGATDQGANNDPITINNSGNAQTLIGRMNITSYNLHGLTTTSEFISATNFTVNNTDNCNGATGGIQLANNTKYILTQNYMNSGNVSLGTTFNTTLYFCLYNVPASGISGQTYDTSASVAWEVRVF